MMQVSVRYLRVFLRLLRPFAHVSDCQDLQLLIIKLPACKNRNMKVCKKEVYYIFITYSYKSHSGDCDIFSHGYIDTRLNHFRLTENVLLFLSIDESNICKVFSFIYMCIISYEHHCSHSQFVTDS